MKIYNVLSLVALVILIVALPLYATREAVRMEEAQVALRERYVADATVLYLEMCATCHGATGEGLGAMPSLNSPGLATARRDMLFDTIAHSPHGSAMAAWHVEEGGVLTDYEVQGLVTLIREGDWGQVGQLADSRAVSFEPPTVSETDLTVMEGKSEDPHECRACHEEPAVHADRFGLNCARCHGLQAWKPALLTRHTFMLDHGGEGKVSCQTCHTATYAEYTCYECHDHSPEQMMNVHTEVEIHELDACVSCHPTGSEGETMQLQANQLSVPRKDGGHAGDSN